ncbi:uncharacterized protein LOC119551690 isoform X1 [Drosophila subpulchrella]|uniref:uncharacterized protein LOC119551690 isoform X1 n=1 Tax=Drosophila subpulchrella TaxID=1486046 RepID=UPI0018A16D80|nr:uncharacterized protein LOC119551690 isoform X1 [Drosophila subpulchrella]
MSFAWLVLLSSCFLWQMTTTDLVYRMNKIECVVNKARVTNVTCKVKPINWNLALVNMDCFLIVPVLSPVIRVQVFVKDYSNQFQPFLVDVSFNLCEVVERRNFVPYGVIVWKLFQRFTNANNSGSFSGHLHARNGYLDTSLLPPFPHGVYQVSLTFTDTNSTNRENIANLKFFIEAMDRRKSKKLPKS